MQYQLVHHAGADTIHQEHPWEECNVDDAEKREVVDEMTARALLEHGAAKPCGHCKPFAERR